MDRSPLKLNYADVQAGGPEARLRERMGTLALALLVTVIFNIASATYIVTYVPGQVQHQVEASVLRATRTNCLDQVAGRLNANRERFAVRELLAFDQQILDASLKARQSPKQRAATDRFLAEQQARLDVDLATERTRTPGLPRHATIATLSVLIQDLPRLDCVNLARR